MASTDAALQRLATSLNLSAGDADEMAAGNARIQVMYDERFGQCMSARGNAVRSSQVTDGAPLDAASPVLAATAGAQVEGDTSSLAAEHALAPVISRLRRDCDGEEIVPVTTRILLSPGGTARLVALTEPHGGGCFGEPGQNAYLVERAGDAWSLLLAAEPGSIVLAGSSRLGHADVELRSLGLCVYQYGWSGRAYGIVGSHDCALPAPPNVGTLPGLLR